MANTRIPPAAPARLPATRLLPDLDTCTDADMIDLAAELTMAPAELPAGHVERLCRVIETMHSQLEVARGLGAETMRQLLAERDAHQRTVLVLEAEIADASRQKLQLIEAQTAVANAAALDAKIRQVVLSVTGRTVEDIEAEHEQMALAEQADVRRRFDLRVARESAARAAYEAQGMLWDVTDVVDLEALDEPVAARTVTPRVSPERMAEIVEAAR